MRQNKGPLRLLNILLTFVGITQLLCRKHEYPTTRYVFHLICIANFTFGLLSELMYLALHNENVYDFTENAANWITGLIVYVDVVCHFIHRDELADIVDEFVYKDYADNIQLVGHVLANEELGEKAAELKRLYYGSNRSMLRVTQIFLYVYAGMAHFTIGLFIILPVILETIDPVEHHRELPFGLVFPWDTKRSPNYEATYVLHAYFGTIYISACVGMNTLFVLMVSHIVRQLKIAGFVMLHLNDLVVEVHENMNEEWQRDCTIILANCAHHYSKLKMYTTRLNTILQPFFLVQAACSSIMICLCLFIIAISEQFVTLQIARYYCLCMTIVVQIFICSWVGQLLNNESRRFQKSVNCEWWLHTRQFRSSYTIFHASAQRNITMYIWGSIDLSLATFGAIMKTSLSYLALLLSLVED